ncbi:MAG: hypothetical protein K2X69_08975 [Silvanigrellaceae bacterium]|nr:hypothetical protein [Silvanigrellaceae bacterium]
MKVVILATRSLPLDKQNINLEERTVPIKWSTGAKVVRKLQDGTFVYEQLSMDEDAVDLSELNAGAPILLDHSPQSVENVVGVVVRNSAKINNGEGFGYARFSTDPKSDAVLTKVNEGVITKISPGYLPLKGIMIRKKDDELYDTIFVTKWKPIEISLVAFPADNGTHIGRSNNLNNEFDFKSILTRGEENMDNVIDTVVANAVNEDNSKKDAINPKDIIKAEQKRIKDIELAFRAAQLPLDFATQFIDNDIDINTVREKVFIELEKRSNVKSYVPYVTGGNPAESIEKRNNAIATSILNRFDPEGFKLDESSMRFRNMGLLNIARVITNADNYVGTNELVTRALSTSDFPNLMANVLNKKLRREYEYIPRTYEPITFKTEVADFKPVSRVQLGDVSPMVEKPEHGTYREGKFADAAETYAIKEYGRKIIITRKMLINDDLNATFRLPTMFARRAAELEADLAFECLLKNNPMSDKIPLFDLKHKNYAQKGGLISVQTVGEALRAMRSQVGISEGANKPMKLNIRGVYLFVPAALEAQALQFLHQTTPTKDQDTNPYKSLKLIVEPRLDDVSTTAWYIAADLGQIDLLEMAYLQGQSGVFMESKIDFDTDGIALKCRLDVGAKAIDYRGFYKNEGASAQ